MFGRRLSGGAVLWLVVGVIVAAAHHPSFFDNLATVSGFLSALLAIVLWPLVLLGAHITIAI